MRNFTTQLLLLIILLGFSSMLNARTIFVEVGGIGDGSSWQNALGDLSEALEIAKFGDQIWIAKGIYYPNDMNDRTIYFEIRDGIELYGGFAGTEKNLQERNWIKNVTTLSGDIGRKNILDDNSYTVIYTRNVSSKTIIDGITVAGGAANDIADRPDMKRCGGAWFNHGKGGTSNPTIKNCTFIGNTAREGAAIYNYADEGNASPQLVNCEFVENKANLDGGAIYNHSRFGIATPSIKDCRFVRNEATYGGGIFNFSEGGESSPVINGCLFEDNTGYVRGGSIGVLEQQGGRCQPTISASTFNDNKATVGREEDGRGESKDSSRGSVKKM